MIGAFLNLISELPSVIGTNPGPLDAHIPAYRPVPLSSALHFLGECIPLLSGKDLEPFILDIISSCVLVTFIFLIDFIQQI